MGLLLQAQLELTQLFGNAHDILYSSTSHREQLYVGGEYVRYIVCLHRATCDFCLFTNVNRMTLLPFYANGK